MPGPLNGLRIVELAAIGPGPHAGMILGDLGADVVRVERPGGGATELLPPKDDFQLRNRRSLAANMKSVKGLQTVLELIDKADVLVEGYRPGVAERLRVGPDQMLERNPRLVYARITGWGRSGPLAERAGHDINYIAVAGALHAFGSRNGKPVPPLNLVGDLGGGSMLLVIGILAALWERERSGQGQVVDTAMVDGTSMLMQMIWALTAHDSWSHHRGTNLIDTGAPFYDTYSCSDDRYVAVGAIEPQFFAELLDGLGIPASEVSQHDASQWDAVRERFASIFVTRTRDEWAQHFENRDACVSPVLTLAESAHHPQIVARETVAQLDNGYQAMPAPRFSRTSADIPMPPPEVGGDTDAVLADWGVPRSGSQPRKDR